MEAQKIDPAPLEEFSVSTSRVDLATLTEQEIQEYERLKADEGSWIDDAKEKELYDELLQVLAEVVDDVLPTPISLFVREAWIERIARYVFTWVLKQIVKILQDV